MATITRDAATAIEQLFEQAVVARSVAGHDDICVVSRHEPAAVAAEESRSLLVALNISSYFFRIVALFAFQPTEITLAHLAKISHSADGKLAGQALEDVCSEFSNMICGTVSRGLNPEFRHVGMSTPFTLESTCSNYLSLLNPAVVQAFRVKINDSEFFTYSLCICVHRESALDFKIDLTQRATEVAGELELF